MVNESASKWGGRTVMAQKIEVRLVDDLNGDPADETVQFGIDGAEYEIDLSSSNAKELRRCLAQFVDVARRQGRSTTAARRRRSRPGAPSTRERNQAIRDWAKTQGLEVSDRGRIAQDIVARYDAR
jgi:hypothetical protein